MLKTSFKYALICGAFLIALFFISIRVGVNPFMNLSHLLFDVLIFGLFIFFACKEYRTYRGEGVLHFWQGMSIGFLVYGIASLVFLIALTITFQFDETLLSDYKTAAIAFLEAKKEVYLEQFGAERFETQLSELEKVTATDLVISSGVKKLIAGFFVTPVISIILRKKPK